MVGWFIDYVIDIVFLVLAADFEGTRHEQRGPEQQPEPRAGGELPPQEGAGGAGQHPSEHAQVSRHRLPQTNHQPPLFAPSHKCPTNHHSLHPTNHFTVHPTNDITVCMANHHSVYPANRIAAYPTEHYLVYPTNHIAVYPRPVIFQCFNYYWLS